MEYYFMFVVKITNARKKRDKQILRCIHRALADKIAMTDKPIDIRLETISDISIVDSAFKIKRSHYLNLF